MSDLGYEPNNYDVI